MITDLDVVYARMIEAAGRPGDVLVAISTSGNSPNILHAIEQARKSSMTVIGMTGEQGGKMRDKCDILLNVPSFRYAPYSGIAYTRRAYCVSDNGGCVVWGLGRRDGRARETRWPGEGDAMAGLRETR
jgi:D-arabinose 5-phosphate isomerase GutQ